MKKQIMVRAHEIAKTLDGDYTARMSEALTQAWAESRKPRFAEVVIGGNKRRKSWIAQITGTHEVYGLARSFVNNFEWEGAEQVYKLGAGVYEVSDKGKRYFIEVINGEEVRIDAEDAREFANRAEVKTA